MSTGRKPRGIFITLSPTAPGVSNYQKGLPGESFTTSIEPPLQLDQGYDWSATVISASIYFSAPNITAASGNLFVVTNTDAANGPIATQTIILPDGLYSFTDLATSVNNTLVGLGYGDSMIQLVADSGAQRIYIVFTTCLLYTSPSPRD